MLASSKAGHIDVGSAGATETTNHGGVPMRNLGAGGSGTRDSSNFPSYFLDIATSIGTHFGICPPRFTMTRRALAARSSAISKARGPQRNTT